MVLLALALVLLNLMPAAAAVNSDLGVFLQKFPDMEPMVQDGALSVAYVDPDTHKVITEDFGTAKKEKRAWYDDNLTRLLKQKRAYGWCEAYCGKQRPYTVVNVVYTTSKVCGYGRCIPSTATVETTTTEVADTTVTCEPALPSFYRCADIKMLPATVETTSTVTTTTITSTVTETTTLTIPTTTVGAARHRRAVALPAYLRGYRPGSISAACHNLLPRPTTTTTYTRTRIVRTRDGGTTTTTTTATATSTPTTTTTTTILTTHTESTTTTTTVTVCPQTTPATGIAITSGSLKFPNANSVAQCCAACYTTPGCVGWVFLGSLCAFGVHSPPNTPSATSLCPVGKGDFSLFLGGSGQTQGGPGQCAS
ncbi:hypothetical protein BDD12DRAFT_913979 [Trichophaea hybrida]|nr:hypothetical protein BDD12DRAFT_913979 [Trichophaea hybrida]